MTTLMFDSSRRLVFGRKDRDKFLGQLDKDNRTKQILGVETAADLLLDPRCFIRDDYRLTKFGGSQMCQAISPGLYQLLRSADEPQTTHKNRQMIQAFGARVVNMAAQVHEENIIGCKMVLCNDRRQLDGFVGRSYTFVSNLQIYEMFADACDTMKGSPKFHIAELLGREMSALLLDSKPTRDKIYTGVLMQNSETAGRAIRVAPVLFDGGNRSWSVAPFTKETKIPHLRSKFIRDKMMVMADHFVVLQTKLQSSLGRYTAAMRHVLASELTDEITLTIARKLAGMAEKLDVSAGDMEQVLAELHAMRGDGKSVTVGHVYMAGCVVAARKPLNRSIGLRQMMHVLIFGES